ncbi:MAG: hypothetical protein QOF24_1644 [Verrucomicrobiota bacterium]
MLRYALDEGCQIPPALAQAITQIDQFLIKANRRSLSEVPTDVIAAAPQNVVVTMPTNVVGPKPEDVIAPASQDAVSSAPQAIVGAGPESVPPAADAPTANPLSINEVILQAHNALSNLVAPATAQSLRATDPAIVLFGLPPIAKFAIIGAAACTLAFLTVVSKPVVTALSKPSDESQASATPTPAASLAPARTATSPAIGKPSPTPALSPANLTPTP